MVPIVPVCISLNLFLGEANLYLYLTFRVDVVASLTVNRALWVTSPKAFFTAISKRAPLSAIVIFGVVYVDWRAIFKPRPHCQRSIDRAK